MHNATTAHGKGNAGISHIAQCRARVVKAMKESSGPKHQEPMSKYIAQMNSALDSALRKKEDPSGGVPDGDASRLMVQPPKGTIEMKVPELGTETGIKIGQGPEPQNFLPLTAEERRALAE